MFYEVETRCTVLISLFVSISNDIFVVIIPSNHNLLGPFLLLSHVYSTITTSTAKLERERNKIK